MNPMQLCQCGCGNLTKKGNRFIRFHYLKIHNKDPAFRKYLSNFQKERFKNPQNHPCFGKILPEETKRKISNAHTGKKMSKEFRRKQSERMKKRFRNPELNPSYGKPAWNKGLTKETDNRVLQYSLLLEKAHAQGRMKKNYAKISEALKNAYLTGAIEVWSKGQTKATNESIARSAKKISDTLKGKYTGENNPFWKGGYEPYYGPNWREQKRRTLERDNYACKICRSNERVEVHHIKRFDDFGRENYKKANNLNNLITLCIHCHRRLEWTVKPEELVAII